MTPDKKRGETLRSETLKHFPSSHDLLATLIELLADQENVKITYECEAIKRFGKDPQYGS